MMAAVVGALVVTGDYGIGSIRTTFAAVLVAEAVLIMAAVMYVLGLVSWTFAHLVFDVLLPEGRYARGEALPALFGAAACFALAGLLGLAVGTLRRHSAGAFTTVIGLLLLPSLFGPLSVTPSAGSPASPRRRRRRSRCRPPTRPRRRSAASSPGCLCPWPPAARPHFSSPRHEPRTAATHDSTPPPPPQSGDPRTGSLITRHRGVIMSWNHNNPRPLPRRTVALAAPFLLLSAATATRAEAARPRGARVVAEEKAGPRLVDLTIDSPALGGPGMVRLLTPDGWEGRRPGDRWPVIYLLVGGDGNYTAWTEDYGSGIQDDPRLRNVLVVMPGMPLFGFYTDWFNHGSGGPPAVETFHLHEVRPLLERDYGAGLRRVAAGDSQGGFGALSYAARHPGLFQAVASFSGFVHPSQHPHAIEAAMTYLGLDWKALWGDPVTERANWRAHDPYHLAERLRGLPVHLASGDGTVGALDPPGVAPDPEIPGLEDPDHPFPDDVISPTETLMARESRALARRLNAVGARVTTHFYAGTHSPSYWVREWHRSLPMLLHALHARRRPGPSRGSGGGTGRPAPGRSQRRLARAGQ
jgi:S-formylglutathione hydrolase FrmB